MDNTRKNADDTCKAAMTCRRHILHVNLKKIVGGVKIAKKIGAATVKFYFWHKSKKSNGTVMQEKSRGV